MKPIRILFLFVFLLGVMPLNAAWADKEYFDKWPVTCQKEVNGVVGTYTVYIDLKNPDKQDAVGFGTARSFDGNDGRNNCLNQEKYDYTVVSIEMTWNSSEAEDSNGNAVANVTFNHGDNKAYWDEYYDGYNPPDACDYTKNCHGFSMDGDWIDEPTVLMNVGPFVAGQGSTACYVEVNKDEAQVAADVTHSGDNCHSIKVTSKECEPEPPENGPVPFPAPPKFWIINHSEEQFRESGTYTQDSVCPDNVNLKKAHGTSFDNYKLYKKN